GERRRCWPFEPVRLVAGALSGEGARVGAGFVEHGHDVAMVARGEAQLGAVADAIASAGHKKPHAIAIDLARSDSPARIAHELLARGLEPAVVVNNAGFGLYGPAAKLDRAQQLEMIDVNVRTLTDLSLRWIETLIRHKGGTLNVASIAGFL